MKTNLAGIELIKRNEGCRLTAYQDVVGVWTIGYGHTGPDVRPGLTITQERAEQLLVERLTNEFEPGVAKAIGAMVNENQFSAMVSLAYNIGVGAFAGSTLARLHRAGDYEGAANAFASWNKAGGRILEGLIRRRKEEADLYRKPTVPEAVFTSVDSEIELNVRSLQTLLLARGFYAGKVDGDPGPLTQKALEMWRHKGE